MSQTGLDMVKACLKAYVTKDRAAIEGLLATDYTFTSPIDNKLSRESYFEICWPNSENMTGFDFIEGVEAGETVFVVYEGHTKTGDVFRNSEMFKVRDGKIASTEVYFGWNVPHSVPAGEHKDNEGDGHA